MITFLHYLHTAILGALWPGLLRVPPAVILTLGFAVGGAVMLTFIGLTAYLWTWAERRIAGVIQVRLGPNRVGPAGLLQSLADGLKLLAKEDIVPAVAHRGLFTAAPLLVFVGAMLPLAALPFSERWVVANMTLGIYYILAFEAIEVIGVLMAGWAPGSKWSLYGGMRLAAQMISYEIPMGLCVLVIVMLAGSLNLGEIVAWQSRDAFGLEHPWILGWAVFRSPAALLGLVIFYIGGLAATKRAPFDLPEAESELVAGYHTEYTGMRFAYFFMAEYASMYIICALSAVLFLGGWHGPIPRPELAEGASFGANWAASVAAALGGGAAAAPVGFAGKLGALAEGAFSGENGRILLSEAIGALNLVMKSFALYVVMIWVRWTLPRVRIDQVMYLCLKVLLPFGLGAVVWAAVQAVMAGR